MKNKIKNSLACYKRIVIWGAGGLAKTAIKKWLPLNKVIYCVDKNTSINSKNINGIEILPIKNLKNDPPDFIVVCTSAYVDVYKELKKMNVKCPYKYIYELFSTGYNNSNELSNLYIDILATKNCNFLKLVLTKPQILVNISFRLSKFFKKSKIFYPFYFIMYFFHYLFCLLTSIQLPLEVEAGPGLIFAHPGTIVFTGRAKLGSFVTIYHCCTIGTTLKGGSPIISDFVTIYAGSHVLGDSYIGKHSKVGALSLVLDYKSKDYSTIVGIPAKTKGKFIL